MAIRITDVALRDGLQMEPYLKLVDKLAFFSLLSQCGFSRLEITSFVNPKWVPQFIDADEFCAKIFEKNPTIETMAFVPNVKGYERLAKFPIPWVSAFIAASETFNQKNVNQSRTATLDSLKELVARAKADGRKVRIYVSTVFGCPYEKSITDAILNPILEKVAALGPDEIALSDTIGVALPKRVKDVVLGLSKIYPVENQVLHLHNTYGFALANVQAGLDSGVVSFDGSVGGLGGCPYAKGATGNLASDELALFAFRQKKSAEFPSQSIAAVIDWALGTANLSVSSRLADIRKKGGGWYEVD